MRSSSLILAASMAVISVYGPQLTLADAAPAPSPAPDRVPRYYFPRNVKRFTNTTSFAAPTPAPEELKARQILGGDDEILDDVPPIFEPPGPGSNNTNPNEGQTPNPETPPQPQPPLDLPDNPITDNPVTDDLPEVVPLPIDDTPQEEEGPVPEDPLEIADPIVEPLPSAVADVVDPVVTPIPSIVTGVAEEVPPVVDDATSAVGEIVPSGVVPTPVEELVSTAVSAVEDVVSSDVPDAVGDVLTSLAPSLVSEVTGDLSSAISQITVGLSEVIGLTTSLPDLGSVVSEVEDNLPPITSLPIVTEVLPSELPLPTGSLPLSEILSELPSEVLPSIVESIVSSVQSEIESVIPTNVPSLVEDISSIVQSAGSSLAEELSTQLGPITTPLPDLPSIPLSTGIIDSSVLSSLFSEASSLLTPPSIPAPTGILNNTGSPTLPGSSVLNLLPTSEVSIPVPTSAPVSIRPTATGNFTEVQIPSDIVQQPDPTSAAPSPTFTGGIAPGIPRLIQPPDGLPEIPENSTLVQIGFQKKLNYNFVVANWESPLQIFHFMPIGVTEGLGIPLDSVTMQSIRPYDTTNSLGFITTLALMYVPSDMTDKLGNDLNIPVSALYNNEDDSVNTLMNMINPTIPLIAGSIPDSSGPGIPDGVYPTGSGRPGGGGDPLDNGDGGSNQPVKPSSVGIALACVGGGAAYAAAMFFVARRYRRRKSMHLRSSSMPSHSRYSSPMNPAWMSGAREFSGGRDSRGSGSSNSRSVRTAQISAPVMAENSLGWN